MARFKSNKRASSYDEGDDFVASDNEDPSSRPTKKARTAASTGSAKDAEGNLYWDISNRRRVTITDFKGQTFVNIREYYQKDGKDLPGKKGIALSIDQFSLLVDIMPELEKTLKGKGVQVPRPKYDGPGAQANEEGDEDENDNDLKEKEIIKSNIEATSDEDEDE